MTADFNEESSMSDFQSFRNIDLLLEMDSGDDH